MRREPSEQTVEETGVGERKRERFRGRMCFNINAATCHFLTVEDNVGQGKTRQEAVISLPPHH